MMKMFNPPYPGEVIKDLFILPLKIDIKKFCIEFKIDNIENINIDNKIAKKLAKKFNTSTELWINMQRTYNEHNSFRF